MYPFTKEELTAQIDELWDACKDQIDYQAIADLYKRNGWMWGGYGEPMYTPEFRDIRSHIQYMFKSAKDGFISMYFDVGEPLDYERDYFDISAGRIRCILRWDETSDVDDKPTHSLFFSAHIDDDIFSVDKYGFTAHMLCDDDDDL